MLLYFTQPVIVKTVKKSYTRANVKYEIFVGKKSEKRWVFWLQDAECANGYHFTIAFNIIFFINLILKI